MLEDGMRQLRQAFEDKEIVDYTDNRYYNVKFLKVAGSPSRKASIDEHVMAAFSSAPAPVETLTINKPNGHPRRFHLPRNKPQVVGEQITREGATMLRPFLPRFVFKNDKLVRIQKTQPATFRYGLPRFLAVDNMQGPATR